MKFQILNRWSRQVQFECELEEIADETAGQTLGRAVREAIVRGADLSRAVLRDAVLSGAVLSGADLTGADLYGANLRGADLYGANLRGANLYGANLYDADLSRAVLRDAVLSDADLRDADLRDADLRDADLRDADLRDAAWIPKIPDIHKSVYAAASVPGALDMGAWHNACGTTHCRAGWVVTLAGEGGKVMEGVYGTSTAAALIYQASDPTLERIPDFYCSNGEALADMKRLAEQENAS